MERYMFMGLQRIVSAVKKERDDTNLLEYHIYDSPHETKTFEERFVNSDLKRILKTKSIKFVPKLAFNLEELTLYENNYISKGYEGLMARNVNSSYKFKNRSYDLQRLKDLKMKSLR